MPITTSEDFRKSNRVNLDKTPAKIDTIKNRNKDDISKCKEHIQIEWIDLEEDEDTFGTILTKDYCVEAFNNCETQVLFKIYREVFVENVTPTTNNNNLNANDDWFKKNEIRKVEIVGSLRLTETTMRSLNNLPKIQYFVIKELIDTEETYIRNMKHIIDNYLQYFKKPEINPNIDKVFGNIEEIYEQTLKLCNKMKTCFSVEEVANVFVENVQVFDCYTEYMRNKSQSHLYATRAFEELIANRQIELKEKATFESYLLNPVQRPGRYKLLLEKLDQEIRKTGQKCESLTKAIQLVNQKITEANTKLVIDSIQYCPIDLRRKGCYLMKDSFNIKDKYKSEVVLFEKCVVFCKADKNNSTLYYYVEHIEMDKLTLRHSENSLSFHLASFDKIKNQTDTTQYELTLEAPLMDIKENWVSQIHKILWQQLQYYKDLHIKQNRTKKLSTSTNDKSEENENSLPEEVRYCDIEGATYDERNELTGTFFDKHKNLRIELLRSESLINERTYMPKAPAKQCIFVNELINDEKVYLEEIKSVIDNYQSYFERIDLPSYILDNIKDICTCTEKLHSKFLKCDTIESFIKIFLENADIFDCYKEYIWNWATFERYSTKFEDINNHLLNNHGLDLNESYEYSNFLLNPFGKLEKYKQTLEKLEKEIIKIGEICPPLNNAVILVNKNIAEMKTLMAINSIRCCPINLRKIGRLIMKDTFKTEYDYNKVIFLFKEGVIFCTEDQNRHNTYVYNNSIEMKNLSILYDYSSTSFDLRNLDKFDNDIKYTFTIKACSMPIKEKWINAIKALLWGQLQFKVEELDGNKSGGGKVTESKGVKKERKESINNNGALKRNISMRKSKIDATKNASKFYSGI